MIEMNAAAKAAKLLGLSGTQRRDFFVAYGQKRATFDPANSNQDAFKLAVGLKINPVVSEQFAMAFHEKMSGATHRAIGWTKVDGVELRLKVDAEAATRGAILDMAELLYTLEYGNGENVESALHLG